LINKANRNTLKLNFPHSFVSLLVDQLIQEKIKEKTAKQLKYWFNGDGAYKDPVGKMWN